MKPPCSVEWCRREQVAKGLCKKHWQRLNRNGDTELRRIILPTGVPCIVEACDMPAKARGMCIMHYIRTKRNGDPCMRTTRTPKTAAERFAGLYLINPATGCWEWIGWRNSKGYGYFWYKGAMRVAHRVAYELFVSPIPDGMNCLHHCDNPPCVNYQRDLYLGTHQDNMADMRAKGRSRVNSASLHAP